LQHLQPHMQPHMQPHLQLHPQQLQLRPQVAMVPNASMIVGARAMWAPQQGAFAPQMAPEVVDHKAWNSDDEEIDEFGRKKRRRIAAPNMQQPAMASGGGSSASSQARRRPDDDETPEDKAVEPAGGPSKRAGAQLSEKQKAALERLHARSKKPPSAAEPAGCPAGEDQSATPGAGCGAHAPFGGAERGHPGMPPLTLVPPAGAGTCHAPMMMPTPAMFAAWQRHVSGQVGGPLAPPFRPPPSLPPPPPPVGQTSRSPGQAVSSPQASMASAQRLDSPEQQAASVMQWLQATVQAGSSWPHTVG